MPIEPARPPLRHRLETAGVNTVGALLRALPLGPALKLLGGIGVLAGVVFRVRRSTVDHNVGLAFPDESPARQGAIARGAYRHLAQQSGVLMRMAYDDDALENIVSRVVLADDGTPQVLQWMQERYRKGKGTVLLMGHFGNWEIAVAAVTRAGVPIIAVATTQSNAEVDERIKRMRRRLRTEIIPRGEAKTAVPRALTAGRTVVLAADQFTWDGLPILFFGHPTLGARGPAVFARRAKVPAVFLSLTADASDPTTYTLHLMRLVVPEQATVGEGTRFLTQAYFNHLESVIREHPEQYLWHHRRWRPLEGVVDEADLERLAAGV
jgi:KDO2-lipid IV(A) lauroyltransferase